MSTNYLTSTVPDPKLADTYVGRYVHGVLDFDVLKNAQKHGQNVIISGPTGAGKTLFVRAFAASTGQPFVNVTGDGSLTPEDLFGQFYGDAELPDTLRWISGPVLEVVLSGGILNLDEVNFLRGKVTAALHGLFDGRRVLTMLKHPFKYFDPKEGQYFIKADDAPSAAAKKRLLPVTGPAYIPAHPDLLVVASYNPDYQDTAPLNEAFANRFSRKVEWDYDTDVEARLIFGSTIKELAAALRTARKGGEIRTDVSTNLLMSFEEMALDEDLTFAFAQSMFLSHFPPAEQPVVSSLFDLHKVGLMEDYGWEAV